MNLENISGLVSLGGYQYHPSAGTIRQRKASDLKNRTALANSASSGVLVSIHQNSLPESRSVHGAQAFYNGAGEEIALAVQEALNSTINDRPKEAKSAGSGVYLLSHAEIPAVLVECGFLSNPGETDLLNTQAHQTRLALVIFTSVLGAL